MPKSLALANGNILVLLDKRAQVRDFYFPYVGLENHIGGRYVHRIGIYVDNTLKWLDDESWKIDINSEHETLASKMKAVNEQLQIELDFQDVVYNEKNIFIRKIIIKNTSDKPRLVKIFFSHEFELYESHRGDTAYYDPEHNVLVHYKGRRVFLINALSEGKSFDDYAVGLFGLEGKRGTHVDAEDGQLSKNPIEHGLVDSICSLALEINANDSKLLHYWLTVAKSIKEAHTLNSYVLEKTPVHLMKTTEDFWHAWVNKQNICFCNIDTDLVQLFKKSLFLIRSHIDNNGGVLAAGDSDMLEHGRDTYSYVWPRDGCFVLSSLLNIGDVTNAERFFEFCNDVIEDGGYLLHKYRPDRSLGSSWHPWIVAGEPTLPIQEDETAHVLVILWKYYEVSKNLEFIESIYNSFIKKAADFLKKFTDEETGLPKPSYDLWEEQFGVFTFTASCVYAGLMAAANFAALLGKTKTALDYDITAEKMKNAILHHLYNTEGKGFYRMIKFNTEGVFVDKTIDMSCIYGLFHFGILPADDPKIQESIKLVEEKILCKTAISGVARYEDDKYYRVNPEVPGNPWFITTLWLAQYYIEVAKKPSDLEPAMKWLKWVQKYSLHSGVMSEQLNPYTGAHISTAPLTWSHSEFVITVTKYIQKCEALGLCKNIIKESGNQRI